MLWFRGGGALLLELEPIEIGVCESTKVTIGVQGQDFQDDTILSDASLQELMTAWIETQNNPQVYEPISAIMPLVAEAPSVTPTGLYLATQTNGFIVYSANADLLVLPTNADIQCNGK